MAVAKWILIVLLFNHTGITATDPHETDDVTTYFLEKCHGPIVIKLHKNSPNSIVKIHLFEKFLANHPDYCRVSVYAYVDEFYTAWYSRNLTQRLKNYKVLVTVDDLNWPDQCDKIFGIVGDAQRNGTTMCNTLEQNLFHYRFEMHYRRLLPLQRDYFLDMSVAVAYLPDSYDNNGCPSNEYFQCASDSLCIPSRFFCDNVPHCDDHSDEVDCRRKSKPPIVSVLTTEESVSQTGTTLAESSSEDYSSEEDSDLMSSTWKTVTVVGPASKAPATTSQSAGVARPSATGYATPPTLSTKRKPILVTTKKPIPATTKKLISNPNKKLILTTIRKPTPTLNKKPIATTISKPTSATPDLSLLTTTTTTTNEPGSTIKEYTTSTMTTITGPASTVSMKTPSTTSDVTTVPTTSTVPTSPVVPPVTRPSPHTNPPTSTGTTTTRSMLYFPLTSKPGNSTSPNSSSFSTFDTTAPSPYPTNSMETSHTTPTSTSPKLIDRQRYDIGYERNEASNEVHHAIEKVFPKPTRKSLSSDYNDAPYPFGPRSDRLDSQSRRSSANGRNNGSANQLVIVLLCLVLLFIYFFL